MPRRESLSLFKCDRSAFLFNGLRKGQPLAVLVVFALPLVRQTESGRPAGLWNRCASHDTQHVSVSCILRHGEVSLGPDRRPTTAGSLFVHA